MEERLGRSEYVGEADIVGIAERDVIRKEHLKIVHANYDSDDDPAHVQEPFKFKGYIKSAKVFSEQLNLLAGENQVFEKFLWCSLHRHM